MRTMSPFGNPRVTGNDRLPSGGGQATNPEALVSTGSIRPPNSKFISPERSRPEMPARKPVSPPSGDPRSSRCFHDSFQDSDLCVNTHIDACFLVDGQMISLWPSRRANYSVSLPNQAVLYARLSGLLILLQSYVRPACLILMCIA